MSNRNLRLVMWALTAALAVAVVSCSPFGLHVPSESDTRSEAIRGEQQRSVVSIVRSDNPSLSNPVPADFELTYPQIEQMVRRAVDLAGGLEKVIPFDDAWIVIKPNIVRLDYPSAITDWRVVKALLKIVHETTPNAKITIAEGAGDWASSGHTEQDLGYVDVRDGFAETGYRQLLSDPELSGIALDIVDLNYDESLELPVPGGGNAREKYFIPKTILDCDVLISVPKMKMHKEAGVTAGMKNMVGIAPGLKYGWAKMNGYPHGSGNPGLPHTSPVIDEMIVDLNLFAGIDFCLVDALFTQDRNEYEGPPLRLNLVLAGSDVVSVDAVCARLIGLNPDDVEHLTLAQILGLGIENLERIDPVGETVSSVMHRFTREERWTARYGQGNRTWILKGPFPTENLQREVVKVTKPKAVPGENGWSGPVYFGHDKIDLAAYFNQPTNCVAYAYTEFTAPETQPAELWVGSDEDITVWINGKKVYTHGGRRRHLLPNVKAPVTIPGGKNRLLVKIGQTTGEYGFSLNICEIEEQEQFAGNRVFGLKFLLPSARKPVELARVKAEDVEDYAFGEELVINKIAGIDPLAAGETAPEKLILENIPRLKEGPSTISSLQAALASKGDTLGQEYLLGLSGMSFSFNYCQEDPWMGVWYLPDDFLSTICERLGYSYAYSYNEEAQTAWIRLKGWISQGYPVIVWQGRHIELAVGYDEPVETLYLRESEKNQQEYRLWASFSRQWLSRAMPGQEMKAAPQFTLGDRIEGKDRREGILASLAQAVRAAQIASIPMGHDTLACGFAAYDLWLEELPQEIVYDQLSKEERERIIDFDGYLIPQVAQNRKAAAAYLRDVASLFAQGRQELLLQAAEKYQAVGEQLEEIVKLLPQGDWEKAFISEEERAKFAQRAEVARLVREAYQQEKEAIALLEQVVK